MSKTADAGLQVQQSAEELSLQRDLLLGQLTDTVTTMGRIQMDLMQLVQKLTTELEHLSREVHIHDQQLARRPDTVGQDG